MQAPSAGIERFSRPLIILLLLFIGYLCTGSAYAERTTTYYHTDATGSVVAASDETGALLWRKSYRPYGDKVDDGEGSPHSLSFTGKPHDEATGLTYMGARYYDPAIGRFMGIDAVGFQADNPVSFNRYAYANNNPYKYVDPDGNAAFLIPLVVMVAKELAAEGFERATGMPALFSGKGAAKFLSKKLLKKEGKDATKGPDFYRGAKPGAAPDFTPRPNEFKVDKVTGTVKPTHGVSVFDNPSSVSSKGFVPHKVDQSSVPDTLQIIQRGKVPRHFEITPKPGANLTPQQFIDACSKISCSN
ncbi:hypothetical protein FKG94_04700 [Exilibacterium tricleocarpae]|uniref:Teneurin-like YD-shell domain-containing protein n=2 Tax=Exilibacterium tricleocarpae TaxID=2591008 RepID=A0A545U5U7_9GAMM|nr:hypothetical protein FKG94_04700 [Exilibacterium tricleocarpae]